MRVLKGSSIYECQSVVKQEHLLHGKLNESCTELSIALVPVHPLNRNVTIRVMAYTNEEKDCINDAFNRLLIDGYADLNCFEHLTEL